MKVTHILYKNRLRGFSVGPLITTSPFIAEGADLICGRGVKIPHALQPKNINNIVRNSIKTLKMVHVKKKSLNT